MNFLIYHTDCDGLVEAFNKYDALDDFSMIKNFIYGCNGKHTQFLDNDYIHYIIFYDQNNKDIVGIIGELEEKYRTFKDFSRIALFEIAKNYRHQNEKIGLQILTDFVNRDEKQSYDLFCLPNLFNFYRKAGFHINENDNYGYLDRITEENK